MLSLPPLLLLLRTPLSAITLSFSFFFLCPSSPSAHTCTLRDSSLSLTWNNPIVLTRSDTFSAVLDSYILRLHVWVGGRANSESSTPGTTISLAFVWESLRKVYRRSANARLWVKRLRGQTILFLEVNRYQTRHSSTLEFRRASAPLRSVSSRLIAFHPNRQRSDKIANPCHFIGNYLPRTPTMGGALYITRVWSHLQTRKARLPLRIANIAWKWSSSSFKRIHDLT